MATIIKEVETNQENLIITSLIVSDFYIKHTHKLLKENLSLLKTQFGRAVAAWCLDYYKQYKIAPKKDIKKIFDEKTENDSIDETTSNLIEKFLSNLSENYTREDNFNESYVIDQTKKYLKERKLKAVNSDLNLALKNKQIDDAESVIKDYKQASVKTDFDYESVRVFDDKQAINDALEYEEEALFKFHGALGRALREFLRGDLISFIGPAKRGKTFWMIESAIKACLSGLRVVLLSFEMTKNQNLRRIYQNILGEVFNRGEQKTIDIP